MILIALVFFFLMILTCWSWRWKYVDHRVELHQFPKTSVGIFGALTIAFSIPMLNNEFSEWQVNRAMSLYSGKKVYYDCEGLVGLYFGASGAPGYVMHENSDEATLRYDTCLSLKDFLWEKDFEGDRRYGIDKIVALHTVSHELQHMLGALDESVTECKAVQRNYDIALAFGVSHDAAVDFTTTYWRERYLRSKTPGYYSSECKKGGRLDEDLPNAPWNFE